MAGMEVVECPAHGAHLVDAGALSLICYSLLLIYLILVRSVLPALDLDPTGRADRQPPHGLKDDVYAGEDAVMAEELRCSLTVDASEGAFEGNPESGWGGCWTARRCRSGRRGRG